MTGINLIYLVLLSALVYGGLFVWLNRKNMPKFGDLDVNSPKTTLAGHDISVSSWNIGYAGLGAKADFVVDGGSSFRALNKPQVIDASKNIALSLSQITSDVILLQENAGASLLTHGVSVRKTIENALPDYSRCFWSDFNTRLLPKRLKIKNGMSVFAKKKILRCAVWALPQEKGFYYGMFKKYYGAMVQRFPIENSAAQWVVINIHLAAFDGGADTRSAQIDALFEFATKEYAAGNFVIIGGDWNLKISKQEFPHKTEQKYLFWIFDFPAEKLPKGWRFATDETTPTVRTLHKPYVAGENYTMIIDGFAVSPNVRINQVQTKDSGFEYTDHHPVTGYFSTAKP